MDWITDHIAIGNYLEAQDRDLLGRERIRSILGLDGKLRGVEPGSFGVDRLRVFDLIDGPGNDPRVFQLAVDCVRKFVRDAAPLLVHCHAGRSRSIVVVAGYFVAHLRSTRDDALARVTSKREANITAGLASMLETL
ncbi:MAG: dual specificity protein phosphatase family protein [Planctomycetes bacterium]|nr:dual specificity protein phosphatase family protein [Planctomycetota bacterium]